MLTVLCDINYIISASDITILFCQKNNIGILRNELFLICMILSFSNGLGTAVVLYCIF